MNIYNCDIDAMWDEHLDSMAESKYEEAISMDQAVKEKKAKTVKAKKIIKK